MDKSFAYIASTFEALTVERRPFEVVEVENRIECIQCISIDKTIAKNNALLIYRYLLGFIYPIALDSLPQKTFHILRSFVDHYYVYIRDIAEDYALSEEEKAVLRAYTLSLKLGGAIPVDWLLKKEHATFVKWIKANRLQHIFFTFRYKLAFDEELGPLIPFRQENGGTKIIPWGRISIKPLHHHHLVYLFSHNDTLLFETTAFFKFVSGYATLYKGILAYDIYKDTRWLPYDYQDPREWNYQHILEVWTVCQVIPKDNPSLFRRTHGYIVLKDCKGNVRSVGQDILMHVKEMEVTEVLSRKPGYGKIMTPDNYVYCPLSLRQFKKATLPLSKEAHDRIIQTVEKDKANKEHSMSVMRGNCVSYVVKLLHIGPGISIDPSLHGMHIFAKALLPSSVYRFFYKRFDPWYRKQHPFVQKALFFTPPFYVVYLIVGLFAYLMNQNSYQNRKDFTLKDIFFRPWRMAVDHPLKLHRELERLEKSIS